MAQSSGKRGRLGAKILLACGLLTAVVLIAVAVPTVLLFRHLLDRSTCKSNQETLVASLKAANGGKVSESPPIGLNRNEAQRAQALLWELFTKPGGALGDASILICPESGAPKQRLDAAEIERYADASKFPSQTFPRPLLNCFYSVRNVHYLGRTFTEVKAPIILFADRSPSDDGLPLSGNSANHRWGQTAVGQYVCFSSGEVKWCDSPDVGVDGENMYAWGNDPQRALTKDEVPKDPADTILMPLGLVPNL